MDRASLATPRLRIETARQRLETLNGELGTYLDSDPYHITDDPEIDGDSEVQRFYVVKPFPDGWSIIVSELIHHLRAALDNLVWQLVLLNGRTPNCRNQFPIFTPTKKPPTKERLDTMLRGIRDDHRAFIEELQPYKGPHIHRNAKVALRSLASLSNIDKHRDLHPTFAYVQKGPEPEVTPVQPGIRHIETTVYWGFLEHGAPILRVQTDPPHAEVRMKFQTTIEIAFGDQNVIDATLGAVTEQIEWVVEHFRPDFPQ